MAPRETLTSQREVHLLPPPTADESRRLETLASYAILDTPPSPDLNGVVALLCRTLGVPMGAITLLDERRCWLKAEIGMGVSEVPRDLTFCAHTVSRGAPLLVRDAREDDRFKALPMVTRPEGVRAYAGAPLRSPDGQILGALCVLDRRARTLTEDEVDTLCLFADQVMFALNQRRNLAELAESRARLTHASRLLHAIAVAQDALLSGDETDAAFAPILEPTLVLTGSAYGFIAEVKQDGNTPYLETKAVTDLAWNEETRALFKAGQGARMQFRRLDTLFGEVIKTGDVYISNSPSDDPRRGGLPSGHPPLSSFLGLPIKHGAALVGMIGVANRPGGYRQAHVEELRPFLGMCATLLVARRAEVARRGAEQRLAEAHEALKRSHGDLLTILDQLAVGTLVLDADGAISFASRALYALPIQWTVAPDAGVRWELALPVSGADREALSALLQQPAQGQRRLRVRVAGAERPLELEIDVREDPRAPSRRILFVYDVTTVLALQRELNRRTSGEMIGESTAMHALYELIGQIASGSWTVLIEGETGAGKELVARAIHAQSPRRDGPFVAVNCAGISDALLSSQLFGHARGAFTGAFSDRAGLFEAAHNGTLFLDEIGDISPAVQVALLRALEQREVLRLGEVKPRKVDVRLVTATNRDLAQEVAAGRFRKDLFYRVRVGRVPVPPLRERPDDIPLLVSYFLAQARLNSGKAVTEVHPEALRRLVAYGWPGNVRELKNAIEYAVIRCRGGLVSPGDLPPELSEPVLASPTDERSAILSALAMENGSRVAAARRLGISRATLYRKLERLGIGAEAGSPESR